MKFFLLAFLFLLSVKAQAQVLDTLPLAPKGATWLYYGTSFFGESYGKYTYTSDTNFLSRTAKKITYSEFQILISPDGNTRIRSKETFVRDYFFFNSNDSVFWFNKTQFDLLYIFNAQVGTSWKVPKNNFIPYAVNQAKCIDSFNIDSNRMTITNLVQNVYSGRKFTVLQSTVPRFWTIGSLIKNIGSFNAPLIPINSSKCSNIDQFLGVPTELICYYDNLRGYIGFSGSTECRGLITSNNELNLRTTPIFSISPNPVQNTLHIENDFGNLIKSIKIYDLIGREFISIPNFSNTEINVTQLPNGIYILKALTVDNDFVSMKFVKAE